MFGQSILVLINEHIAVGGSGLQVFPSILNINHPARQKYFNTLGVAMVRWSHDGTRIAFGTQTFPSVINPTKEKFGRLYVIDSTTYSVINSIYTDDTTIYGIDWSADDKLIATYSIDGLIKIWRVDSLSLLQSIDKGSQFHAVHISFSLYGGRLAFGSIVSGTMNETDSLPQTNASGITKLLGGAVEIFVPVPSLERLKSVMRLCGLQSDIEISLNAQVNAYNLKAFIEQVSESTDDQISLGCKGDLLAVAKAVLATAT